MEKKIGQQLTDTSPVTNPDVFAKHNSTQIPSLFLSGEYVIISNKI